MDLAIGIGGAAGQGIATPGDILARIFVRRGLHLNTYNAYQSIVRGGHIFLTLRVSEKPVLSTGDKLDLLMTLNQDTMDRHLKLMGSGSIVLYNSDKIQPGAAADGVQLCPFSVKELAPKAKGDLVQNTIALAAALNLIGLDFKTLTAEGRFQAVQRDVRQQRGDDAALRRAFLGGEQPRSLHDPRLEPSGDGAA